MAEKPCKACKMNIDAEATICPHCRTKQGMGIVGVVGTIFLILLFMGVISNLFKSGGHSSSQPSAADIQKQPQREAFIQECVNKKIFYRVEQNGEQFPKVWTGVIFNTLAFKDKQNFISAVYAYAKVNHPGELVTVTVKDNMTGKEIGEYSETNGGLKLY